MAVQIKFDVKFNHSFRMIKIYTYTSVCGALDYLR